MTCVKEDSGVIQGAHTGSVAVQWLMVDHEGAKAVWFTIIHVWMGQMWRMNSVGDASGSPGPLMHKE